MSKHHRITIAQMLQPTFDRISEVHRRWQTKRNLDQAAALLREVARIVTYESAPRTAKRVRLAQTSLEGARRHADRMHREAQRACEEVKAS